MNNAFLIICILISAIAPTMWARASDMMEGQVKGIIGLSLNRLESSQSPLKASGEKKASHFIGSLGVQVGLTDALVADLQLSYGEFEFMRRISSTDLAVEQSSRIHIPLLMRFWLTDFFSVGAGFYGSYLVGGIEKVRSDNNVSFNETSASDVGEHGIELALSVNYPLTGQYGGYIEIRRSYSLTPRINEARDWNWLFVGLYRSL